MSNRREIFIDSPGPLRRLADEINAVLHPDTPLRVRQMTAGRAQWDVAEGAIGSYPLLLLDAQEIDRETSRGYAWYLSLECQQLTGERGGTQDARCNRQAVSLMTRLGAGLRARCFALSNLQSVLGEYHGRGP